MSILIKGMDISPDHIQCVTVFPEGFAVVEEYDMLVPIKTTKYEVALVPTPHGSLKDENWLKKAMITTLEALKKNPRMDGQEMHLIAAFDTLRVMVENAPTVIEAEEGEE